MPGAANSSSLNGTWIEDTFVARDDSKNWQIALVDPSNSSLVFSGFSPVDAAVPFDRDRPPAKISAKAQATTGCKSYDKGYVPDSPVDAKYAAGSEYYVDLVPLAHTNLRLTVLPVMA